MWGSFAVLTWYTSIGYIDIQFIKNKRKIYILDLSNARNPSQFKKTARALSNMLKTLEKFKNGAINEIKIILPTFLLP